MAARPVTRGPNPGRWLSLLFVLSAAACNGSGSHPGGAAPVRPTTPSPGATTVAPGTAPTSPAGPSASAPSEGSSAAGPPAGSVSSAHPCAGASPPGAYQHVVWILMENRGLDQVDGASSAPYVNTLGRECGLATHYSGVAHPSLPNYLALTSGSTHGVSDDGGPSSHPLAGPSIFSLLGPAWTSLQESMPVPCDHSSGGEYATKHNPAVYYTSLEASCPVHDVAMNDAAPDVSARFTFITPNLCDDGHDCSLAAADRWLSTEVPRILDSAEYRSGTTALFITWDENESGGDLVATYVVAASVRPATRDATPFTHYSLLRTTEELLGIGPLLGAAAGAPSMRPAFHL